MEYIIIFTWSGEKEKYAIKILASTKEEAIQLGVTRMLNEYRHFDSVEAVSFL